MNEVFGSYVPGIRRRRQDEVIIVIDYGEKTHAMFGDVKNEKLDEIITQRKSWIRRSHKLIYGPGWLIRDMSKLDELITALQEAGFDVVKKTKKEYEKKNETSETLTK